MGEIKAYENTGSESSVAAVESIESSAAEVKSTLNISGSKMLLFDYPITNEQINLLHNIYKPHNDFT